MLTKFTRSIIVVTIIIIATTATGFSFINKEDYTPQNGDDLCKGTDGTGRIISIATNGITIKRNDSTNQTVKFTSKTKIKSSAGVISKSDLKVGERVTLVVDDTETAALVLVCNMVHPKKQ